MEPTPTYALSPKYEAFLEHRAPVEFLEGTTAAGKTTVSIVKFIVLVCESPKKFHVIAARNLGTLERNILNKDRGLLDTFGKATMYHRNGYGDTSISHVSVMCLIDGEMIERTVYLFGYEDRSKWQNALGGQYGVVYIDEINIADMEFVREISIRCNCLIGTLNPDDPDKPIYKEYINHSRPLPEWADETPKELLSQLNEPPERGWVHWYFSFKDNISLSREDIERITGRVAPGTKLYKNKILGLRGRAEGLIFNIEPRHVVSAETVQSIFANEGARVFSCGVDTSYSQNTGDTFAFIFIGITGRGKCLVLAEKTFNNRDLPVPVSPSDIPLLLIDFLEKCRQNLGFCKNVWIDSADSATIAECNKYRRLRGSIYKFIPAPKKTPIIDRINLQTGWLAHGDFLIYEGCREHLRELNSYSWMEGKDKPEDRNDHTINACQYAWLPHVGRIGVGREE